MAEISAISWTDATFNPWIGCTRVSPACDDCYAARDNAHRGWVRTDSEFNRTARYIEWNPIAASFA